MTLGPAAPRGAEGPGMLQQPWGQARLRAAVWGRAKGPPPEPGLGRGEGWGQSP